MKKAILASLTVVVCAIPMTTATAGGDTRTPGDPTCSPAKVVYAEKDWRDAKPEDGRTVCRSKGAPRVREHFRLYRHYRADLAPYRCQHGSEGYYAIPCGIVACESHFNWMAANPSGAVGVYQLLGWGAPYPARTFRQRLENHQIAAGLSLSNWVCA